MKRILFGIVVLGMVTACATLPLGQRYAKQIIGSWIVAGDSPDYLPVPMHERFFGDGTARIYWFSDGSCLHVIGETHLAWHITNDVLISRITKSTNSSYGRVGDVMKAKIISMSKKRMVLHSLDDGTTYVRTRSTRCLAPKRFII